MMQMYFMDLIIYQTILKMIILTMPPIPSSANVGNNVIHESRRYEW